jgi:hypothetical protein
MNMRNAATYTRACAHLTEIEAKVAQIARDCGLQVIDRNDFDPTSPPMVYGTLDSIAILIAGSDAYDLTRSTNQEK